MTDCTFFRCFSAASAERARLLARWAPHAAMNSGFRLLCAGDEAETWERLSFASRAGARGYYEWLLQLAARNYDLPL